MDTVVKIAQPAPEFRLPDLHGDQHALRDFRGQIVVINFWSAKCPWALRADQQLLPMLQAWGDEVYLLSIAPNANETIGDMSRVAEERKLAPVLHDADQTVAKSYGALTTPHIFVLDPEGVLRYQGAFDDVSFRQPEPTVNYLHRAVEALLAGERPQPAEVPSYGCTVVYHNV